MQEKILIQNSVDLDHFGRTRAYDVLLVDGPLR